jgi:hypothetical protein
MKRSAPLNARVFLLAAALLSFGAVAHTPAEVASDIKRHRAMAAAHEGAAKCLESGKKPDVCHKELQAACKGLALGKYCGMRHEH